MTQARAQLSILGILKEALLTILRNAKILSSFILVILLPLKLLCRIPNLNPPIVLHVASIAPYLLSRLALSDSPVTINIFPTATIVSHITTSIAVYLSTMCYNGSHLGLNELFSKFKRTWRGLLATIVVCELFTWVFCHVCVCFNGRKVVSCGVNSRGEVLWLGCNEKGYWASCNKKVTRHCPHGPHDGRR
ncbi:uncharacterized protein LOC109725932 [Ananas comosus]|uniref:Uncharacterized protein LOC109725932 n=1 Tax=Ananas comosus TaxID=4615 RepID=A0A6P5GSX5_ANACO|nr:uncharacterized protein LOC109725932 [Ananas comosus]